MLLRNEELPDSEGYRNTGPDLAVDSRDDPHILYPIAANDYRGYYASSRNGGPWQTELVPEVATAALALDAADVPHALFNDGALHAGFWRRGETGWQHLESLDPSLEVGPGSLTSDASNCFHAGVVIENAPAYFVRTDHWTSEPLSAAGSAALPVVALAASGQPHLAFSVLSPSSPILSWAAPPSPVETVSTAAFGLFFNASASLAVTGSGDNAPGDTPHVLMDRPFLDLDRRRRDRGGLR